MEATDSYKAFQKSPYRSIKLTSYFDSYDHLFGPYRNKEIVFVEIGVLAGGSLFIWRDFFGPEARIIGIDLNPNAKMWEKQGFEIFIGNQSDQQFWDDFKSKVGPVDIVLDDGGHTFDQQITTVECLLENVRDGGMLVVEDTHTSYMNGFGPRRYSFIEYVKILTDKINFRYEKLSGKKAEDRIWSIEILESIVAFRVNRPASLLKSERIDNGGQDNQASDFRYKDNKIINAAVSWSQKFRFLKSLPFVKPLVVAVRNGIGNRNFRAKKYFKR